MQPMYILYDEKKSQDLGRQGIYTAWAGYCSIDLTAPLLVLSEDRYDSDAWRIRKPNGDYAIVEKAVFNEMAFSLDLDKFM